MVQKIIDAASGRWLNNKMWFSIIVAAVIGAVGITRYVDSLVYGYKDLRTEMSEMKEDIQIMKRFMMQKHGLVFATPLKKKSSKESKRL